MAIISNIISINEIVKTLADTHAFQITCIASIKSSVKEIE